MDLFFSENAGSISFLNQGESHHAIRVLRKVTGDEIEITDGKGNLFIAEISDANPRKCTFEIKDTKTYQPLAPHLHIGIAPTKSMDRILWFVEKSVEIGINEISFIRCHNSERTKLNLEKVNSRAVSAMKQSQQYWLPKIHPIGEFSEAIAQPKENRKFIANLDDQEPKELAELSSLVDSSFILIGPEGDFTDFEIKQSLENGFQRVALGTTRLRTETAGIVAATLLRSSR